MSGPDRPVRPVGGEPDKSRVEPAHGDVAAGAHGGQLLAVGEDTAANRLLLDASRTGVLVGHKDEVLDIEHGAMIGNLTAHVNGFLTDGKAPGQRSEYRAMLRDILQRIEDRLAAVGLDPATASARAGLSKDAIRNIKRRADEGKEDLGVSTTTLVKLAPVLQTTPAWLIEGVDCGMAELSAPMRRLWEVMKRAERAGPEAQARLADFAEIQLERYEKKSLEIETNPPS